VLGFGCGGDKAPVGRFCGTGQHGGKIFLRTKILPEELPPQVSAKTADAQDKLQIDAPVRAWCAAFGVDAATLLADDFIVLTPNSANPYESLYTQV
jgi:hypothetical protein